MNGSDVVTSSVDLAGNRSNLVTAPGFGGGSRTIDGEPIDDRDQHVRGAKRNAREDPPLVLGLHQKREARNKNRDQRNEKPGTGLIGIDDVQQQVEWHAE